MSTNISLNEDMRRDLSERLFAEVGLIPQRQHRFRTIELEVVLALMWQVLQVLKDDVSFNQVLNVLVPKLWAYLMGQGWRR